jgi:Family of unknown function (DUF6625)
MPAHKPGDKFAVLLMPYFGSWPEWIDAYFETCRWNRAIDYIFFTDCGLPKNPLPSNVSLVAMTLSQFNELYAARFPCKRRVENPYKLCDLRPAYGVIFAEYVVDHQFFGWGDIDVVYGDVAGYLTAAMLSADIISFSRKHISGHLTLARTSCADRLVASFPNWPHRVDDPDYQHLDEPKYLEGLTLSAVESFNTPLSPIIPWTDGRFVFPTEWYWRAGQLTNDLDRGRSFPYLHFMHWKGGDWPRKCGNAQWERLDSVMNISETELAHGFRINSRGFFPLQS